MNFFGNLVINSICIAILIVLFLANLKNCRDRLFAPRLFEVMLAIGIIMFIIDTLGRMDGTTNVSVPLANAIGNFLLFAFNMLIPMLWLVYVIYQLQGNTTFIRKLTLPFVAYFTINLILVILNLFFGFFYTIDANNVYARGSYYFVSILLTLIPLIASFVLTFINYRKIDYRKFSAFLIFPLAPMVGTALTFVTYGYSIVLPSLLVAFLLVFISIQAVTINVDYLTGVFNRRYLEDALRRKMNDNNPLFALIMLDLDGFKRINDTYGHLLGDRALVDFARVLQKSVAINDIVARYGGDEFMIIVETRDKQQLQKVLDDINAGIDKLNAHKLYPFDLTASFGHDLYDHGKHENLEQFINRIDLLMYRNKKER